MFSGLKHFFRSGASHEAPPVVFGAPQEVQTALKVLFKSENIQFFDYHHIVKNNISRTIAKLRALRPSSLTIWQNQTTQLLLDYAVKSGLPVHRIQPGCLELLTNRYPDSTSFTIYENTIQQQRDPDLPLSDLTPFIQEIRKRYKSTNQTILILGANNLTNLIASAKTNHPGYPLVYLPNLTDTLQLSDIELCQLQGVAIYDFKNESGPLDPFLEACEVYTSNSIFALVPAVLGIKTTNLHGPVIDVSDFHALSAALNKSFYFDYGSLKSIPAEEAFSRALGLSPKPLLSNSAAQTYQSCPVVYVYTSCTSLFEGLKAALPYYQLRQISSRSLQDTSSVVYKKLRASSNYGLILCEQDTPHALDEIVKNTKNSPYTLYYGPMAGVGSPQFVETQCPYSIVLSTSSSLSDMRVDLLERTHLKHDSDSFKRAQTLIDLIKNHHLSQFTPTTVQAVLSKPTVLVLASSKNLNRIYDIACDDNPGVAVVTETDLKGYPAGYLDQLKALYTDDHPLGLEALVKGIPVITFGNPFYAGWGLTSDRYPHLHRNRTLSLEELVYAIYIKQPLYLRGLSPESIIEQIKADRIQFDQFDDYAQAKKAFTSAQYEKGIALFQSVLEKNPKAAWFNDYGNELLGIKKVLDAIPFLEKARELDPRHAKYTLDLAFALQLSGDFSASTAALFKEAINLSTDNFSMYVDKYLRFLWEKEGISKNLLDLCTIYHRKLTEPSSAFLNTYAAILHQSGNTPLALNLYHPDGLNSNHLALRAVCTNPKDNVARSVVAHAEQYKHTFERLISENADSFCVIGNSPCELGSGNGPRIDQKNLVIRLNNFSVDYPFSADYGKKTDVWVRNGIAASEVINRDIPNLQHTLFTGNNYPHRCRSWSNLYEYAKADMPFEFLPDKVYTELIQKLESLPSTGLKVCYWIYKLLGPLPRDAVYGFSFVDQMKDATKTHYFDHAAPSIRHRWDRELELFESLLAPTRSSLTSLPRQAHG